MTTPAFPATLDIPRPPWRALALLTLAVIALHLALLGVTPVSVGTRQTPLDTKFTTRTIVIAPPPAAAPPTPAPVAEAKPQLRPAPPRPTPRPPRPAASAPEPAHEHAPQDLLAQNAIDAGEAEASASPDASDAGTSTTGSGNSAAAEAAAARLGQDKAGGCAGGEGAPGGRLRLEVSYFRFWCRVLPRNPDPFPISAISRCACSLHQ